ncbi:MAG: hypothetical protein Hyperionvirus26_21 [Hyperionvirus sp.]|uniref:Uncharacterized protein n=1 Tax=Hyperionvirus sp. TaxID=2487770 RepID=A0A3G5AB60_9VIRU|nr:MAG: hypothetical protein Hyperionvirus26_21 [Hyperionvirus sp.]
MDYLTLGLKFLKDIKVPIDKDEILEWFILETIRGVSAELILLLRLDENIEVVMLDIYGMESYLHTVERENILEFKMFGKWLISYRKTLLGVNHSLSTGKEHGILIEKLIWLSNDSALKDELDLIGDYIRVAAYAASVDDIPEEKVSADIESFQKMYSLL